jgi:hypothetical protein
MELSGQFYIPAALPLGDNFGTNLVGGGLGILEKRKLSCSYWDSNSGPSCS